jgi:hypothetical protein
MQMTRMKLFAAAALFAVVATAPVSADEYHPRHHHRHHHYSHHRGLPYSISYLHNYGPGAVPGTFALYDGPSNNHCYQSASAYLGQDHRRHPCF